MLWVAGNHEFYGLHGEEGTRILREIEAAHANLRVLDGEVETIEGVRFVGASLWFPRRPGEERLRGYLSDFSAIFDALEWIPRPHERHRAFLESEVREGDVVTTHHLPHPKSVAPQYVGSALNRF
ncbi:MAG: hypothetical protein ACO1O3_03990, partial [Sphingobium sp.]